MNNYCHRFAEWTLKPITISVSLFQESPEDPSEHHSNNSDVSVMDDVATAISSMSISCNNSQVGSEEDSEEVLIHSENEQNIESPELSQPALSLDNDPAASFVLALRQGHHLSQSALSRVIEHTEVLLQDALSQIESNVVGVLSAKGIDFSADMPEIVQKCYPSFDNVSTPPKQRQYFVKNFALLVSLSYLYTIKDIIL